MPGVLGTASRQGGRFVVVGMVNNIVGYSAYLLLVQQGAAPLVAMTVSYLLGMAISFTGNRRWTFAHSGAGGRALARFVVSNAVAYAANFAILAVFVEWLGWPHAPVQLGALVVVALISFSLMRVWVFADGTVVADDPGLVPEQAAPLS